MTLDADSTRRLTEGARSRGLTVNTLIQLAWASVLSVLTDRTDVTFGVTVSGRPGELAGVERMVGLFVIDSSGVVVVTALLMIIICKVMNVICNKKWDGQKKSRKAKTQKTE